MARMRRYERTGEQYNISKYSWKETHRRGLRWQNCMCTHLVGCGVVWCIVNGMTGHEDGTSDRVGHNISPLFLKQHGLSRIRLSYSQGDAEAMRGGTCLPRSIKDRTTLFRLFLPVRAVKDQFGFLSVDVGRLMRRKAGKEGGWQRKGNRNDSGSDGRESVGWVRADFVWRNVCSAGRSELRIYSLVERRGLQFSAFGSRLDSDRL